VGPNYLVMEFVEGETLRGPLPDKALRIAGQIAEAVAAAHEKVNAQKSVSARTEIDTVL
jgi:hypothetical protein